MIDYTLPKSVNIDGTEYKIRNDCDYRVVLDVICALNDIELSDNEKIYCALKIFYDDIPQDKDLQQAVIEMMKIINNGEEEKPSNEPQKPPIMNWEHDFKYLVAPINRVLGFDIRTVDYLHWWSFLGAYFEIGECMWANIISIRQKRQKGKKLEKWEQEFYRENRKMIDLPRRLTAEEEEFLNSDW